MGQNGETFSLSLSIKAGFLEANGIICQAFKIYNLKGEFLRMIQTLELLVEGRESAGGKGKCWNSGWEEWGDLTVLTAPWKYSGSNTTLVFNPCDSAMGFGSGKLD